MKLLSIQHTSWIISRCEGREHCIRKQYYWSYRTLICEKFRKKEILINKSVLLSCHSRITSLSNTSLSHQQIQFQLVCGVNLNQISLLYMLTYVKSQSPPNHCKPFSAFLWGDSDQASPPLRVKNGAFQICRRLGQILGEDLILLNQPVQSVTFGKFPLEGKKLYLSNL